MSCGVWLHVRRPNRRSQRQDGISPARFVHPGGCECIAHVLHALCDLNPCQRRHCVRPQFSEGNVNGVQTRGWRQCQPPFRPHVPRFPFRVFVGGRFWCHKKLEQGRFATRSVRRVGKSGAGSEKQARVWKGRLVPVEERGIKILGTPIGHPEHVRRFLVTLSDEHQTLLSRIPLVGDVQASLLLLAHCAAGRATCSLRCVDAEAVDGFARRHDQGMLECLRSILHVNLVDWGAETRDIVPLPMSLGGLGVRGALGSPQGHLVRLHAHDDGASPRCRSPLGGTVGAHDNAVSAGSRRSCQEPYRTGASITTTRRWRTDPCGNNQKCRRPLMRVEQMKVYCCIPS